MGSPGGGCYPETARLKRHFNYLSCIEMSDSSKARIFGTILDSLLPEELIDYKNIIVDCAIKVYGILCNQLLPTPPKSHYTFNLRHLAKFFQGKAIILKSSSEKIRPTL